jgi:hypothetical protein
MIEGEDIHASQALFPDTGRKLDLAFIGNAPGRENRGSFPPPCPVNPISR